MCLTKNQATPTATAKQTYTVTAKSCESAPHIEFSISANIHQASFYFMALARAFRDVQMVSNDTGEVMKSHYESDEIFDQRVPYHIAIMEVIELHKEYLAR